MNLKEVVEKINLKVISGELDKEVSGGYSSDLLSDVIANAEEDNIWITLQTHINIVAVANLKGLSAIILINNRQPEDTTLQKAIEENITILSTELQTFELVGKLYELGIHGNS
ncbi:MAG: serine kinase [Candidatus Delongbacteria bacterium]|nr:serine kinase [Candidatus Delongbacteria bacterium]